MRRTFVAAALVAVLFLSVVGAGPASASEYYLDVNISEQMLYEVVDGQAVYATHVSSGSGEWYWQDDDWWLAETPRGWFQIYAKDPGWEEAPLGWLYNAMYFVGGYAIHGSNFVPDWPDSHGCVRVNMAEADYLFDHVPIGTWVYVHD